MTYVKLIHADAIDGMQSLEDESIDLVVTSPPYNVGKSYEIGTSKDEYSNLVNNTCTEFKRVLKPDGRLCINVPVTMNSKVSPGVTQFVMYEWETAMMNAGINIRDVITWNQSNSANDTSWGSWRSASSPWIRHQCEFIIVGYNEQWKKLNKGESDMSGAEFMNWCIDHWDMPCARSPFHPAVFPKELPKRCIKLFSYVGDTILDPFVGSGTVMEVGRDLGRNVIGIDRDKGYCNKIRSSNAFNQATLDNSVEYIYEEP